MHVISSEFYLKDNPKHGDIIASTFKNFKIYRFEKLLVFGNPLLISPFSMKFKYIIDESTNYNHTLDAIRSNFTNQFKIIPSKVIYNCAILHNWWANNFFHWMLESIPKAIIFEKSGFNGTYIVPKGCSFIKESLNIMGISEERIIEYEHSFIAKNLYIADKFNNSTLSIYPEIIDMIRGIFLKNISYSRNENKIYIKRSGKRIVKNELELKTYLDKYDFLTIEPEKMSLKDQITVMANAKALITPHGAGTTHSIFMKKKSLVCELFSSKYINPCCINIFDALKHNYYIIPEYLNGKPKDFNNKYFDNYNTADIDVCLPLVKQIIERELS